MHHSYFLTVDRFAAETGHPEAITIRPALVPSRLGMMMRSIYIPVVINDCNVIDS